MPKTEDKENNRLTQDVTKFKRSIEADLLLKNS